MRIFSEVHVSGTMNEMSKEAYLCNVPFTVLLACQLHMNVSNYLLHFMFHDPWHHKTGKIFEILIFSIFSIIPGQKQKAKPTLQVH